MTDYEKYCQELSEMTADELRTEITLWERMKDRNNAQLVEKKIELVSSYLAAFTNFV